jgi:hypothetical protein
MSFSQSSTVWKLAASSGTVGVSHSQELADFPQLVEVLAACVFHLLYCLHSCCHSFDLHTFPEIAKMAGHTKRLG